MKRQHGFTLIELMLVLVLVAGITWYVTREISASREISLGVAYGQDIAELAMNIQAHHQSTNNYEGLQTSVVIGAGLVPPRMRRTNPSTGIVEAIVTSWNTGIAVTAGATGFQHHFRVTATVPKSVKGCPDAARLLLLSGPRRMTRGGYANWIMDTTAGNPVSETALPDMIEQLCLHARSNATNSWLIEYE